tara:strand:- start:495 stop:668 length:174 start_codon:yes stop_codon:yes gene_type:complete
MALKKDEVAELSADLYELADDLIKAKKRKRPMNKKELRVYTKRAMRIVMKLAIDVID